MEIKVEACEIRGNINAPSSKSYTQRYVLYSAFSDKKIKLNNISFCDDELIAIDIARKCNASIKYDKKNITIEPDFKCPENLYFGESGTSYRLSIGLISGKKCYTTTSGEKNLSLRPVQSLIDSLSLLNVKFNLMETNFYKIDAKNSLNKYIHIDGSKSSQFISSMLFYYSFHKNAKFHGDNIVSKNYIDVTVKCLNDFGVNVNNNNGEFTISSNDYNEKSVDIEGDYSSISYFIILSLFTGKTKIYNLYNKSLQPDKKIINLINNACNAIKIYDNYIEIEKIKSINEIDVDVSEVPDLAPAISVIGIFSYNGVKIKNYKRLEFKESDRLNGIIDMVSKFGADVIKNDEFIFIRKKEIKRPPIIDYNDHRMIMSSIIAGLISNSNTVYRNIEKINKSYPNFLNDLKKLGCGIEFTYNYNKN